MSERKFKFRTMGQYIRNIIDPISVSLISRINGVNKGLTELELKMQEFQTILDNFTTIPIGSIAIWPVRKNPVDWHKWLECDNTLIDPTRFPELYALIGTHTPDLRGLFLRGHGGNSAELGIFQQHATRRYDGTTAGSIWGGHDTRQEANGVFIRQGSKSITGHQTSWVSSSTNVFRLELSPSAYGVPVADEVRPDNKSVRYIIRALK